MKQSYTGGCQCGKVHYQVDLNLSNPVIACNCSRCRRLGSLFAFARGTRPVDGADVVAITTRCLDGVEPNALTVKQVDVASL
ncbi:MAG: hypothetical protein P8Y71_29405 [Pseudolabrys sp.]